jgi:hypothetical protein
MQGTLIVKYSVCMIWTRFFSGIDVIMTSHSIYIYIYIYDLGKRGCWISFTHNLKQIFYWSWVLLIYFLVFRLQPFFGISDRIQFLRNCVWFPYLEKDDEMCISLCHGYIYSIVSSREGCRDVYRHIPLCPVRKVVETWISLCHWDIFHCVQKRNLWRCEYHCVMGTHIPLHPVEKGPFSYWGSDGNRPSFQNVVFCLE